MRYQLNHMYMRYFMWNFAGRQNDVMNLGGELDAGNWISGIPFIDNTRLGDQSLLPDDLGNNNKGHNVFYMLPLLLGLIGLLWEAFSGKRGIEQFWVVFFLFFMTGIAIILYLNQPPYQPRERDYAFAGSFYAYAIWIGMGVAALWQLMLWGAGYMGRKKNGKTATAAQTADGEAAQADEPARSTVSLWCGVVAALLGICVPLQMVSQTWDDHDRSGRYAARDYAINYLESTEPNAIIFCNGDNDTFPLWYAQEVEGVRPDVRIINLSYLSSDWYANQLFMQAYESAPVPMIAKQSDIAYDNLEILLVNTRETKPMELGKALKQAYEGYGRKDYGYPTIPTSVVYIPVNREAMVKQGYVSPADTAKIEDIYIDLSQTPAYQSRGALLQSDVLMLDIIAANAATGWQRPIYWCSTVGDDYYMSLDKYQSSTGLMLQLVPWSNSGNTVRADRFFNNVTGKFRWGGADSTGRIPYFDETAGRMITTMRTYMLLGARQYYREGKAAQESGNSAKAKELYGKSATLLNLITDKQSDRVRPYGMQIAPDMARLYLDLSKATGDKQLAQRGLELARSMVLTYAQYVAYEQNIRLNFGNVSLTIESTQIPHRYWGMVELFEQLGGNYNELKQQNPVVAGLNEEQLRENYEQVRATLENPDMSEGAMQIEANASRIKGLKDLSPAEYAAQPQELRELDTIFYQLVEDPAVVGATPQDLQEAPSMKYIDLERQKRLYMQYKRSRGI